MLKIEKNVSLKEYSTFKIGGAAKLFCRVENIGQLLEAVQFIKNNNEKYFMLGGGSNVVFGDDGFDGIVVKIENKIFEINESDNPDKKGAVVLCGAGMSLAKLVNLSIEKELAGLEWAAGIPGTVGGAIRGNAGAFGGEMKDVIEKVWALNRNGFLDNGSEDRNLIVLNNIECKFGYRHSIFKENKNWLIWQCQFRMEKGNVEESKEKIGKIIQERKTKHTYATKPSAGSIFINPAASEKIIKLFEEDKGVKSHGGRVPAGWLIERCGLKGKEIGGAVIDNQNANVIINKGDATAEDVLILISLIKQKVRNKYGIQLKEEVEMVF